MYLKENFYGFRISLASSIAGIQCEIYIPEKYHTTRIKEIEREIDDFANSNIRLYRCRPLSTRAQTVLIEKYYNDMWKSKLRELKQDEAISCFL